MLTVNTKILEKIAEKACKTDCTVIKFHCLKSSKKVYLFGLVGHGDKLALQLIKQIGGLNGLKVKFEWQGMTTAIITFYEGELEGCAYEIGGDNLIDRSDGQAKYGYWLHQSSMWQVTPVKKHLATMEERSLFVKEFEKAFAINKEAFPWDYLDLTYP